MFQAEIVVLILFSSFIPKVRMLNLDFAKIFMLASSVTHLGLESTSLNWQVTALSITEYFHTPFQKSVL